MADNIQVAIRIRQLIQKELKNDLKRCFAVKGNSIEEVGSSSKQQYSFDRVYDEETVTLDIFEDLCKPIISSAVAGINGTIFAYGQSSSGKTFTMSGTKTQEGIISLSMNEIFSTIEEVPDREYLLRVAYMEIYNERVSDLLAADDGVPVPIKLQQDLDNTIKVVGLSEEVVTTCSQVLKLIKIGDNKRHTAETKQNDRSSRSHSILRIIIESRVVGQEDEAVMMSHLNFVDLAGSEKAGENTGDRLREGCSINMSLFALGNIIRKLSGDEQMGHVSFRDSKLTRILQNALGGNSKTAIICTIAPAFVEESHSTLKFASCAKTIENKPTVNEVMSDAAMLKKYRRELRDLQKRMEEVS